MISSCNRAVLAACEEWSHGIPHLVVNSSMSFFEKCQEGKRSLSATIIILSVAANLVGFAESFGSWRRRISIRRSHFEQETRTRKHLHRRFPRNFSTRRWATTNDSDFDSQGTNHKRTHATMVAALLVGFGIAATAFFVRQTSAPPAAIIHTFLKQTQSRLTNTTSHRVAPV
jgi:hypothetical protein